MICRATRGGEVLEAAPTRFRRLLPATPMSVRRTLTDMRRTLGPACSEEALGRLELVLAEVLNNIVEHGARGPRGANIGGTRPEGGARARGVHLLVSVEAGGLRCAVTDTGMLLPDECLAPRSLPRREPELPEGGFGWYLIQGLVRDLTYSRAEGRNCLAFILPAEEAGTAAA